MRPVAAPPLVRPVKLALPLLPPDLVSRERVGRRLDHAADHAVTLVLAGPGYGKTTELAAWARGLARPFAWLALDPADADPALLLAHLIAALGGAAPEAAPALVPLVAGIGREGRVLGEALADALCALPDDLVLVLDDLHAAASTETLALIEGLLAIPPPRLRLVVGTRAVPELPALARLGERGLLLRITEDDLRFTETDAARFLAGAGHGGAPGVAGDLTRRLEGWPAGVRAYAAAVAGGAEALPERSPAALRAYLAREVLAQQPAEAVAVLRAVAVADRVSPALAEALAGVPAAEAAAVLGRLAEARLFVTFTDDPARERWHRVHAVLRDALLDDLGPDGAAAQHAAAARWFAAQGMVAEAAAHARQAGTPEQAAALGADLLARHGFDWRGSEQWVAVGRWLADLPAATVAGSPALLLLRAVDGSTRGALRDAFADIDAAERLLDAGSGPDDPFARRALRWEVTGLRCRLSIFAESAGAVDTVLAAATTVLDTDDPAASPFARDGSTYAWAFAMQRAGRSEESLPRLLAIAEAPPGGEDSRSAAAAAWIGIVTDRVFSLDVDGALESARRAFASPLPIRVNERLWLLAGASALRYHLDDLAGAEALAREGIAIGPGRFLIVKQELLEVLVRLLDATGRPDEAAALLAEHRRTAALTGSLPMLRRADALAAAHALATGDRVTAWRWLARADIDLQPPVVHVAGHPAATRALALLGRDTPGDAAAAATLMAAVCDQLRGENNRWGLALALPTLALAHEATANRPAALAALREALALEPGLLVRRFVDLGEPMRRLLARLEASRADPAAALAEGVLARFPPPSGGSDPEPPLLAALTPRERQVLRLMARLQTNKEIAASLGIGIDTVKVHAVKIYRKLGVANRREAVAAAGAAGLLDPA